MVCYEAINNTMDNKGENGVDLGINRLFFIFYWQIYHRFLFLFSSDSKLMNIFISYIFLSI
ncbi:hypothetical protein GCM10007086_10400 [Photobacterium aphoticum]|nr:hypothetical protein GCM10007086_10400 [Photobacterium aphoticum]